MITRGTHTTTIDELFGMSAVRRLVSSGYRPKCTCGWQGTHAQQYRGAAMQAAQHVSRGG